MKQYIVQVFDDKILWFNQEGQLHREGDLPAVEYLNGYKAYYVNGKRHRDNGQPAIEWKGYKEYWVNGNFITKEQAEQLAKPTCEGKVVEIDGRKYQLKEIK